MDGCVQRLQHKRRRSLRVEKFLEGGRCFRSRSRLKCPPLESNDNACPTRSPASLLFEAFAFRRQAADRPAQANRSSGWPEARGPDDFRGRTPRRAGPPWQIQSPRSWRVRQPGSGSIRGGSRVVSEGLGRPRLHSRQLFRSEAKSRSIRNRKASMHRGWPVFHAAARLRAFHECAIARLGGFCWCAVLSAGLLRKRSTSKLLEHFAKSFA